MNADEFWTMVANRRDILARQMMICDDGWAARMRETYPYHVSVNAMLSIEHYIDIPDFTLILVSWCARKFGDNRWCYLARTGDGRLLFAFTTLEDATLFKLTHGSTSHA